MPRGPRNVRVRSWATGSTWGSTPADRVDFLRELVAAGELALSDSRHRELAAFFNKVAGAFGFVPLIEFDGETCSLTPGAVVPLRKVFSPSYVPGD